jgi:hypothetical protein
MVMSYYIDLTGSDNGCSEAPNEKLLLLLLLLLCTGCFLAGQLTRNC